MTSPSPDHVPGTDKTSMQRAAQVGRILIGLVFLVAGATKVWDPVLFFWEAVLYPGVLLRLNRELSMAMGQAALVMGPLECVMGVALVVNWRPRPVLAATTVLLAFFTGISYFAWLHNVDANCGCFGTLLERGPGEAAVEDAVMLGVVLFAWWKRRPSDGLMWPWGRYAVRGAVALALVVGGIRFFPEAGRLESSDLQEGTSLKGLDVQGEDVDLGRGDYLVQLFSPKCGRCAASVPHMNGLLEIPGLPRIVALSNLPVESDPVQHYRWRLKPRYTIGAITRRDFVRLTWERDYPRLVYLRDGMVRRIWEANEFPDREELEALIGTSTPSSSPADPSG